MNDAAESYRIVRRPNVRQLASLIRQSDLIHLAGPSLAPLSLGWLLQKPVVVEHHGFQTVCPNGQLFYARTQSKCVGHFMAGNYGECIACNRGDGYAKSITQWLLTFVRRWLCRRVATNVTPTDWLAAQLQLPRMTTIYHGIPESPSDRADNAGDKPIQFAFLGRLVSTKNVAVLVRSMAELRGCGVACRLLIVGDGPERAGLEELASKLGIQDAISFMRYVPEADLEHALEGVTSIVSPGASGEVFGLAAAENMRRGRIAIVPANSAIAEVVGDSGLTFPEGDAARLAAAMRLLITEPDLRRRLSTAARERCRSLFSEEAMVDAHVALYRSLER